MEKEKEFEYEYNDELSVIDFKEYLCIGIKNMKVFIFSALLFGLVAYLIFSLQAGRNQAFTCKTSFCIKGIDPYTFESFAAILKSDSTLEEIAGELEKKMPADKLKKTLLMKEDDGKDVIDINSLKSRIAYTTIGGSMLVEAVVTTADGTASVGICKSIQAVTKKILDELKVDEDGIIYSDKDGKLVVSSASRIGELINMDGDTLKSTKLQNSVLKKAIASGIVGLILSGGLFTVLFLSKKPIRSLEHIKKSTSIPVLSEIPYYKSIGGK